MQELCNGVGYYGSLNKCHLAQRIHRLFDDTPKLRPAMLLRNALWVLRVSQTGSDDAVRSKLSKK